MLTHRDVDTIRDDTMKTMTAWQALDSKMLAAVAYEAEKRILYLRFRGGETYRYFDFPEPRYREFLDAESRGRHFLSHIRGQYRYERLAKLHPA